MNRFAQVIGFSAVIILSGSSWATGSEETAVSASIEVAAPAYQPSDEADVIFHLLLAELASRRGQPELALESFQAAARASSDPRVAERAAGIALFLGQYEAALEAAQLWYEKEPGSRKARQTLVLALLRNKALPEALRHLEVLRTDSSDDGQGGFSVIAVLMGQIEDRDTVYQVAQEMRLRHPESPFAHYYFALAALAKDDREQALRALSTALKHNPTWDQAQLLRAQVLVESGDEAQALASLARAVEQRPDDRELRLGYARLLVGAERLEDAAEQFETLLVKNPDDAEALYAMGLLMVESKDYERAEQYFMEVIRLGSRLMDVYFEMGRLEELKGDFEAAKGWYGRVSGQGRYLNAQIRLGAMLGHMGDVEGLAAHMERLRREYPQDVVLLYLAHAEILREHKSYQQAFDLLVEALERHPGNNDLLYTRALVAERLDRIDVLETDLRAIIAADPDNGHALNALGYTLADRTDRYQEALGYLERAIVLLPEDAAVLDSMGWVNYRLGSYERSLAYLRKAYERSPDAEIAAHLSEVLWFSGRQGEARELWEQAWQQSPDSEYLLRIKRKFNW